MYQCNRTVLSHLAGLIFSEQTAHSLDINPDDECLALIHGEDKITSSFSILYYYELSNVRCLSSL